MTFMTELTASQRFEQAWYSLLGSEPFYAANMFRLNIIEDDSISTMETDGKELRYSPEFVQSLSLELIETVDLHEILHVVLFHHLIMAEMRNAKGSNFDPMRFNRAADYEVNWILHNMGKNLPDGALYDERFNGKLLADIYDQLESEDEQENNPENEDNSDGDSSDSSESNDDGSNGDSESENDEESPDSSSGNSDDDSGDNDSSSGSESASNNPNDDSLEKSENQNGNGQSKSETFSGDCGQIKCPQNEDGSNLSNAQISEMKRELENEIISAWKFSDAQGKGNPIVDSLIDRILTKPVPWYEIVREYFTAIENGDSNWNRFDKRHLTRGMYLPSIEKLEQGRICFMVDVSGSVDSRLVKEWEEKINEIISELPYLEILVIFFHHEAYRFEEYTSDDLPIKLYERESGGTNYVPPFSLMDDLGFEPDCIFVLTDLLCNSFPKDPGIPVLWCAAFSEYAESYATTDVPFGSVVKLNP